MAISIGELEATLRLRDQLTPQLQVVSSRLEQFGTNMRRVGTEVRELGSNLTVGLTVPLVAAATAALKFSSDFENVMTRVGIITDIGAENIGEMRQAVLDLAPAVGIGPEALGEGLLVVASTGIKGAQALEILEKASKASAVGLGETKDVARAVTSAITAYGAANLSAEEATDKLFVAVRAGGAEASEFAGSLGRVVGIASQVGVSFDQVLASVATFTRLGVDADEAITALRGTMAVLLHPSKQAREQLVALGTSMEELRAQVREKGLAQAMTELVDLAKGNEDAIGAIIPNVRALAGIMGTAGAQATAYAENLRTIEAASGDLDRAFDVMSKTLGFKWNQVVATGSKLLIQLGDALAPVFMSLIDGVEAVLPLLSSMVAFFERLPGPVKAAAVAFGLVLAALGPVAFTVGTLVASAGGLAKVIGALALAFTGSAGATALATGALTSNTTAVALNAAASANAAKALKFAAGEQLAFNFMAKEGDQLLLPLSGNMMKVGDAAGKAAAPLGLLARGLGLLRTGLSVLTGPIGWFVGIASAVLTATDSWGEVGRILSAVATIIKNQVVKEWDAFVAKIQFWKEVIVKFGGPIIRFLDDIFGISSAGAGIKKGLGFIADGLERIAAAGGKGGSEDVIKRLQEQMAKLREEQRKAAVGGVDFERTMAPGISLANDLADATKSLSQELAEARTQLAGLTASQRANIRAGFEMGKSADDIVEALKAQNPLLKISATAIKLYEKQLDAAAENAKTLEKEIKSVNVQVADFTDLVSHSQLQSGLRQVQADTEAVTGSFDAWAKSMHRTAERFPDLMGSIRDLPRLFAHLQEQIPTDMFGAGGRVLEGLKQTLTAAPKIIVDAFTGGGGLRGAGVAIGSMLGSTVMGNLFGKAGKSGLLKSFTGLFGQVMESAMPVIGALAGPLIDVLVKAFDKKRKDFQRMGRELGVELSDGLIDQLKTDATKFGGEVQAVLLNLDKIIGEAGGLSEFGTDRAISKTRDLFAVIESGGLTAKEVGGVFDRVFGMILPEAIDEGTGFAKQSFLELIDLARRFGVESQAATDFLKGQAASVASGLNLIAAGTVGMWNEATKSVDDNAETITEMQGRVEELTAKIVDMDRKGGPANEKQRVQLKEWQKELALTRDELDELMEAQGRNVDILGEMAITGQQTFDRVGRLAVTTFATMVGSGATFLETVRTIGPTLDTLALASQNFGFETSGALDQLLRFQEFAAANEEVIATLDGINQMMTGLHNTGMLTQEAFTDLTGIAVDTFKKMTDGGVDGRTALAAMQPTLQRIWKLQKDFGFEVDESTQALVDQAVEAGIVGEQHEDVQERIAMAMGRVVDVLEAMAIHMGVLLPKAAREGAAKIEREFDRIDPEIDIKFNVPDLPDFSTGATVAHQGWDYVRRYHLGTDEVPAILKSGEAVLNEGAAERLGRGTIRALNSGADIGSGGSTEVHISVSISTVSSTGMRELVEKELVPVIAETVRDNVRGSRTLIREAIGVD